MAYIESRQQKLISAAIHRILTRGQRIALVSSIGAAALGSAAAHAQQTSDTSGTPPAVPALEEVVVTAQRRSESVQDIPYNISVLNGEGFAETGATSISDLTRSVAGLMGVDEGAAARGDNSNLTLRGLRTDSPGGGSAGQLYPNLSVSPVSTYFGEVPVFFQMPAVDIDHVEVLRGPQGTLYGSGAQAGTIRVIPNRPDFKGLSGDVGAEGSWTDHSPQGNSSAHAVLNVPLTDNLAFRAVGQFQHFGGFIDAVDRFKLDANGVPIPRVPGNLASGPVIDSVQHGLDSSNEWFTRAALRWQPISAIDVQFDYLHQMTTMHDAEWSNPTWRGGPYDLTTGYWPLASFNTRAGCDYCSTTFWQEPYRDTLDLESLVVSEDLGFATITSATSHFEDRNYSTMDETGLLLNLAGTNFNEFYPYSHYPRIIWQLRSPSTDRFTVEELRLVSNKGKRLDYTVGLYLQNQDNTVSTGLTSPGMTDYLNATGQPEPSAAAPSSYGDETFLYSRQTSFKDRAAFAELTLHATDAWQFTGGIRVFRQTFDSNIDILFPLCGPVCASDLTNALGASTTRNTSAVTSHIWKLNTSYDFGSTTKVYATISEGFRRGGVSGLPTAGPFADPPALQTFAPDLARNYELGVKGSLFDNRLQYFADVFLIDLQNFQFDTFTLSGIIGTFNGSQARSQGVEAEVHGAVTDHLRASLGYAYTDSYVSKSFDVADYPPYALPAVGGNGQTASLFGGPIPAGTVLPGISKNSITASADYELPGGTLKDLSTTWHLHIDGAYRSSQQAALGAQSIYNWTIPSNLLLNARVGTTLAKQTTIDLFVTNLTNKLAFTGSEDVVKIANPYSLRNVNRPRTIGLSLGYKF